MTHVGYSSTNTIKVIKTIHLVTVFVDHTGFGGTSVKDLKNYLSSVPENSKLKSIDCEEDSRFVSLTFEEEVVEQV